MSDRITALVVLALVVLSFAIAGVAAVNLTRGANETADCYVERLAPLPDSVGFGARQEIAIAALGPEGQVVEATFIAERPAPGVVVITAIGRCGGAATEVIAVPDSASFSLPFGELPSPLVPVPPPPNDGTRAV